MKLSPWLSKGLVLPLIVLNGWLLLVVLEYFGSLVTIIAVATLLSFILDYPVKFLNKWKIGRFPSILIVLISAIAIFTILGVTVIPLIIEQFNQLLERLPSWLNSGSEQLTVFNTWIEGRNFPLDLANVGEELLRRISTQLQKISGQVLSSIFSALSSVFDFLLIGVLTFYLLLHGEEVWQLLFNLLPDNLSEQIRRSLGKTFQNYFIGQISVATIMGSTITIALLVMQVPFGLLFGVGVSIMAVFPFGAALSISVISFLVALKSFWLGVKVLAVAFIIQQIIENAIAPRLLGEFTGLNPVLILISLLVGAKIAGFIGLILAVPLASFTKSAIAIYQNRAEVITT